MPAPPPVRKDADRLWPQWKKDKLLEMKREGKSARDIAVAIDKTEGQIGVMYAHLRKTDPNAAAIPVIDTRKNRKDTFKKRSWGSGGGIVDAKPVSGEVVCVTDEQGHKITRLPPGYADGAYPECRHTVGSSG